MTFNIVKFSFCVCVCLQETSDTVSEAGEVLMNLTDCVLCVWWILFVLEENWDDVAGLGQTQTLDWNMSKHSFLWHISSFSIDGLKCYTLNKYTHPQLINGNKKEGSCLLLFYSRQINRDERLDVIFKCYYLYKGVSPSLLCSEHEGEGCLVFNIFWHDDEVVRTNNTVPGTRGPRCNWSQINNRVYIGELYLVIIFIANNCTWFVCW